MSCPNACRAAAAAALVPLLSVMAFAQTGVRVYRVGGQGTPAPPALVAHQDLAGRVVRSSAELDETESPARVGRVTDLVVDLQNGTTPFLVIQVDGGPRTPFPWGAASFDAGARTFTVAETLAQMRSRAEIRPDLLGARSPGPEPVSADEQEPAPLPRFVLASRLERTIATARDGAVFGRLATLFVDLARGDVPFATIAVGGSEETAPRLHVVPWTVLALAEGPTGALVLRIDRDLDSLGATPRLDAVGASLSDPEFRAKVYRAVGLTPPRPAR